MTILDFKNMDIAQEISNKLQDTSKKLTPANILDFILMAMKFVDEKKIEGKDKKQIVYLSILKLINTIDDKYVKDREFLQIILDNVFHSFVENTITVSKNPKEFFYKAKNIFDCVKPFFQKFLSKIANKI
jgi:hypothetical protein